MGESYLGDEDGSDDGEFLEQWREARRKEIMREGSDIRNRRTSPSMRRFGRFDEVDALGYLDAIERVGRETVVVVFVYDVEVRGFSLFSHSLKPRHAFLCYPIVKFYFCFYNYPKLNTQANTSSQTHSAPSAKSSNRHSRPSCRPIRPSTSSKSATTR
jgi:hypothetical protein